MLNTFFFGYLPLKWRRLIRSLIFIASIPFIIIAFTDDRVFNMIYPGLFLPDIKKFKLLLILLPYVIIFFFSWIIKPFVVKE